MRDSFVNTVIDLMRHDDKVALITADLGFGIFNKIVEEFPGRFINVGVAEQSMIGTATGMGLEGWTVFAYSIGNFSTLRCLEQIRNDAAYHEVNVNVVASGGGFTYGALGMSHHATEDLSILRALPGVTVVAPCDAYESAEATRALAARPGVGYLRIEKDVPIATKDAGAFTIGSARRLRQGRDVCLIGSGGIVSEAMKAADRLADEGVSCSVVSMHTLSPLDEALVLQVAGEHRAIVTVEENTIHGGLGGAVAEILAESSARVSFKRVGLPGVYSSIVGDQDYLRQKYGVDSEAIYAATKLLLS
ncbi:transketolase C-terminal domain-containing protein [Mesorhizobium sp. BE184]|uniref:transketolase family protein n=1 Tax=Mesorhizobium sp. BE184 TaxID=2817714 RepID=UPI00285621BD|nr:transketolase C-terminal domain-containing protein [Mesorhizobium sp. BE184]MDR7031660.1 transketolase [Mesorhizobium sp. BE184]